MYDKQIDRFTSAVTKNMGRKQAEEVKRELRAHILDGSEALAAERQVPVSESIVGEVISRMGAPRDIAAEYPGGRKSLLGDRLILGCIAIIVILMVVLAAIGGAWGLLWAFAPAEQREDRTSHAGASKISLDVKTFGDVDIVESEAGDVEVIYTVRAKRGHLNDTATETTYTVDGDTLSIKSEARLMSPGGYISFGDTLGTDVVIKVPRNSQYDLHVQTSYGDVTLIPLNGSSLVLDSGSGDIVIKGGRYDSLEASTSYGSITAKYDANTSTFRSGSGDLDLTSTEPADSLTATTSYGSVKARYNAARATFESGSGDLDLGSTGAGDTLSASTSYGSINARYNAARAVFKSGSGDIVLSSDQAADSLGVTTSYGSITAKYNATAATFESGSGNVDLTSGQTLGSLDASSDYGYVRVKLPAGTRFSVDAGTSYGEIDHRTVPLLMTRASDSHITGYTQGGQGNLTVKLQTGSGDLEISY